MNSTEIDPVAIVAGFERRARRFETPCGDGALVWRAWGSGPPLVLLHGAQGAWLHWIRNIDALAQSRTVWALDIPGCGDSAAAPREDHAAISDAIADGLRELMVAAQPVDMAGFSLGGVVAAHLAARHPELVRRLILVATGELDTPLGHVEVRRGVRFLEENERRAALRGNLLALMLHDPGSVDALALHVAASSGTGARLNAAALVLPDRLLKVLPQITARVDAIWGEFDQPHPTPAVQEEALRRSHPKMAFHVIRDAGHWVMYERPEVFNRTLLDLLALPLTPSQ